MYFEWLRIGRRGVWGKVSVRQPLFTDSLTAAFLRAVLPNPMGFDDPQLAFERVGLEGSYQEARGVFDVS